MENNKLILDASGTVNRTSSMKSYDNVSGGFG